MQAGNTNLYVVDSSIVVAVIVPDETSLLGEKYARVFAQRKNQFYAPELLDYEVGNVLRTITKQGRIDGKTIDALWMNYTRLRIHLSPMNLQQCIHKALEWNVSVHDATYIELARLMKAQLFTLDREMKKVHLKLQRN